MKYSFYFYYLIIQIYKQLFEFIIEKILNQFKKLYLVHL